MNKPRQLKLTRDDFVKRITELSEDFFNRYSDEKGWPMFPWHFTLSEGKYYDDHVGLSVFQAVQDSWLTTLNQMDNINAVRWFMEIDGDDESYSRLYRTYLSAFDEEFDEDDGDDDGDE